MPFKTLDDLGDIEGLRVLVREDLNVPIADGLVTDDSRLRAAAPTLLELADRGAKVAVLAHFGRPKGRADANFSLRSVVEPLSSVLGRPVTFTDDCAGEAVSDSLRALAPGSITVLENTRFHAGEETNDPVLATQMALVGDIYVNDAFSAAHRAHASTAGIAALLPAFAGRSMERELGALEKALGSPEKPVAAVVGGAKVSTKLAVLRNLVTKVDHLIIGGGMANTFLAARGVAVGKSLCEHELKDVADDIFAAAEAAGCTIHLPYDVVTAREFRADPPTRTVNVHEVTADEMILDVGPTAVEALADVLKNCRTLVWNGPLGAFETSPFDRATTALAGTAAALTREGSLISVAGGGDTVAALNHAGVADQFSFVSMAGGAFLEWMEGRTLPGVQALIDSTNQKRCVVMSNQMRDKIQAGDGFIAALDQSGGSTPKALRGYGIEESAYSNDEEMFALIHSMRSRIISSPAFSGEKVIGAILFERTMDGEVAGKPVPAALWEKGVVPFLKIDKGLEDEADGVQMMKPMPELDALLMRAKAAGVFGTKERSVINKADRGGIARIVAQQVEVGRQVLAAGLVPILEPEVNIKSPDRADSDEMLRDALMVALDTMPGTEQVMLKLSIPARAGLFDALVDHPRVLRVVALSGGFARSEACAELAKNRGMIASFSRALLEDLRHQMSDDEFDAALGSAIDEIHCASTQKA